ncbi:MAG: sirohydrochlorin cobaltochelatase [Clostridiales bacterium]|nr:sirohydrochlorin cobaltochelatase [Clostridiales bacterium]
MERAILVVSFGTSYPETRRKTIDQIEQDIQAAYPEYRVYRAWTSKIIRKKLRERDGIEIPDVSGAMAQMAADGIRDVILQPTHMINGFENDAMMEEAAACSSLFRQVEIGAPLLTSEEDNCRIVRMIVKEMHPEEGECLVLMGHGTEHEANSVYAALDDQFKDSGYPNVFMGTVEGYPTLESVLRRVRQTSVKKVVLAPFMIVAGDHAMNDLAGDRTDSWRKSFEKEGYEVRCILKGLGEYEEIRRIFIEHTKAAIRRLKD